MSPSLFFLMGRDISFFVCSKRTNERTPPFARSARARSIEHLRDLKAFFGTTFKIKDAAASASASASASSRLALTDGAGEDEAAAIGGKDSEREGEEYILSCVGTGFTNTAKRAG